MTTPTITVAGLFGKDKEVTLEEFTRRWVNHAAELTH